MSSSKPEMVHEALSDRSAELEWIFAYGSNMHLDDLRAWLAKRGYATAGIRSSIGAVLPDYRLVWNYYSNARRGGAANIEVAPGHLLPGVALQVDIATRAAIDEKEGHPSYYSRGTSKLQLRAGDGSATIAAWVYVARPERCGTTPEWPTREYLELLVGGAIAHGLPVEHIAYLRQVRVRE